MYRFLVLLGCLFSTGCSMLPEISHQPTFHNPFPQLSKVAVAPFFNLSEEPTVDGRQVALAYYHELQSIPGFEVIAVSVVEKAIQDNQIAFRSPDDARRLAQILGVDAVIVGAVTEYSIWYPPRLGLQAEWYAANPCFHPIPPGYGLPWGTPEEEAIPAPLVQEAEFALAKAQLDTQTPPFQALPEATPVAPPQPLPPKPPPPQKVPPDDAQDKVSPEQWWGPEWGEGVRPMGYESPVEVAEGFSGGVFASLPPGEGQVGLPPDWPDPRGFIPPPPSRWPSKCQPSRAPVIRHTQTYNGADMEFTEALAAYYYFRDDARFGGWQGYLERSEDFIRFCCYMHVAETLAARGGVGETRVVWRWPTIR